MYYFSISYDSHRIQYLISDPMAKKLVLDFEMEADFSLLGIVSPIKDYRLTFFLNRALHYHFKREEPFVFHGKTKSYKHSMYHYYDMENQVTIYLIANRSEENVLLPEYKQMDFILILDGEHLDDFPTKLLKKIKSIAHIRLLVTIDINRIKAYDDLAMQFEMCFNKFITQ